MALETRPVIGHISTFVVLAPISVLGAMFHVDMRIHGDAVDGREGTVLAL